MIFMRGIAQKKILENGNLKIRLYMMLHVFLSFRRLLKKKLMLLLNMLSKVHGLVLRNF